MAMYDCDFGRHRYREAQQTVYAHQIMDHSCDGYRLRLCPQHFLEIQEVATSWNKTEDLVPLTHVCSELGCDSPAGRWVFKLYQTKQPMDEREIELCPAHLSRLGNDLRIFNGEYLSER